VLSEAVVIVTKHRPHVQDEQTIAMQAPMAVSLQHLEVWKPAEWPTMQKTMYFDSDPEYSNVLEISDWDRMRSELYRWDETVSETPGCVGISDPQLAVPMCSLEDPGCPVICLLDRLRELEWKPLRERIEHTNTNKVFDCRNAQRGARYFQVMLSLDARLTANPSILSAQPLSYYALVLRNIHVEPNRGDDAYKEQQSILDGHPPSPALALPAPPLLALDDDSDCFDAVGVGLIGPIAPKAKAVAVPRGRGVGRGGKRGRGRGANPKSQSSSSYSDSDDSSSSSSSASFAVVQERSTVSSWVQVKDGPWMKLDTYRPKDQAAYSRLICECGSHVGCVKRRNVNMTRLHGDKEPIAFLMAWNEAGSSPRRLIQTCGLAAPPCGSPLFKFYLYHCM
jgi:hypothetical protein